MQSNIDEINTSAKAIGVFFILIIYTVIDIDQFQKTIFARGKN